MTATKKPIELQLEKGEEPVAKVAKMMLAPYIRHAQVFRDTFAKQFELAETPVPTPDVADYANALKGKSDAAAAGDLDAASRLLVSQAITLDALFTELARIAMANVMSHMDATERYMRLALRAQGNSRTTLEALAKLHQPREQTVRHVHVNEGGQAIVADEFHHHSRGSANAGKVIQSHEPCAPVAESAPLLGQDAATIGVPVPRDARPEPMSAPRRKGRRTQRQSKRVETRRPVSGDAAHD
jgi:hypothetical protein